MLLAFAFTAAVVGDVVELFLGWCVQYYFPVHGDGGLKLTVAKYLTVHPPPPPPPSLPCPLSRDLSRLCASWALSFQC